VTDEPAWHATWVEPNPYDIGDDEGDDASAAADAAEKVLLKKLRTRSLSVREARAVVVAQDLDAAAVDRLLELFLRRGYLDDAALADQLVYTAVERKGQGRHVIAQTLAKRGIPRDIADVAIASLPDDDAERALEFARGKARSLASLDRDTAVRRLMGQLARRGYSGSTALSAAKQALDETGSASGVRFR
ncbi:regulatory protein RecX, partial [Microbacterium sp. NPDC055910]|uniref:regulatory protein RecX n=1 Tax=Microbacterium sp. NPDC055910 TaxID=3345659 RepID=UPI0035D5A7B4